MRKFKTLILFFTGVLLLTTSCVPNNNNLQSHAPAETSDTTATSSSETSEKQKTSKPKLRISTAEQLIVINQGDNFDLLSGVTGSDETDGDITKNIQLNKGDYDQNKPDKNNID